MSIQPFHVCDKCPKASEDSMWQFRGTITTPEGQEIEFDYADLCGHSCLHNALTAELDRRTPCKELQSV